MEKWVSTDLVDGFARLRTDIGLFPDRIRCLYHRRYSFRRRAADPIIRNYPMPYYRSDPGSYEYDTGAGSLSFYDRTSPSELDSCSFEEDTNLSCSSDLEMNNDENDNPIGERIWGWRFQRDAGLRDWGWHGAGRRRRENQEAQEERTSPADSAAASGQPARTEADAVDQRGLRRTARARTDTALREATVQGRYVTARYRLHWLPGRAGQSDMQSVNHWTDMVIISRCRKSSYNVTVSVTID